MKSYNKNLNLILFTMILSLSFILTGCETMLGSLFTGTISSNRTLQNRKNFNQQMINSRQIYTDTDEDEYDVLARKRGVIIEKLDTPNTTGSLANPQDPRNNLFLSKDPNFIGQYLDVKVVFNRKPDSESKDETPTTTDATKSETETDPELDAILQMLPTLSPADPNLVVLQTMKMRVTQIYPNGDVSVSLRRSSRNDAETYDFIVNARIPYERLNKSEPISTLDLTDVKWFENDNSYVSEKYSSIWEDEYSLRLSGFKETKSKYALELEDKEDQLKKAKKALESQIYSFKQEKKKFNKMQQEKEKEKENSSDSSKTNTTNTDNKDNDLKPKSV